MLFGIEEKPVKIIRSIWHVIWNIKKILITTIFLISLALNIILFLGGSLFSLVNTGFEALTGVQTVASRKKSEIASLDDELAHEKKLTKIYRANLLILKKKIAT